MVVTTKISSWSEQLSSSTFKNSNYDIKAAARGLQSDIPTLQMKPQIRSIQLEDEVFRRASCEQSRIVYAAESGDFEQVQRILKYALFSIIFFIFWRIRPSLVNWTTSACWSALHMASRFGHLQIVKFLVESGADLNILRCVLFLDFSLLFSSYSRSTPLMEATAAGQVDCVRFLLKKGCKVNLQEISFQIFGKIFNLFFWELCKFYSFYLFWNSFYNFSSF